MRRRSRPAIRWRRWRSERPSPRRKSWSRRAACCAPPIWPYSSSACGRAGPAAKRGAYPHDVFDRRRPMDLLAERGRRVTVEELNTTRLLAHARKQAVQRKLDDMLIVDVDAHHYESEHYSDILPYMETEVLRQVTMGGRRKNARAIAPTNIGYQDMGGRVTRYPLRAS